MSPTTAPTDSSRRKRRIQLLLLFGVFLLPAVAAVLLGMTGWAPGTDAYGEPITPQRNLIEEHVAIRLANGDVWAWRNPDQPQMTLVALPGPQCAAQCLKTLALMRNARIRLNQRMNRVRLLYVGHLPESAPEQRIEKDWTLGRDVDGRLASFRATAPDTVAALLVESNGTALSWYPGGFDPEGLLDDLQKVMH